MSDISTNQKKLLTKGYVVFRKFFNDREVAELKFIKRGTHGESVEKNKIGLHNYKQFWNLITSQKILEAVRSLLGQDIYYLYNSDATTNRSGNQICPHYGWHRGSACRIFGFGPDWDTDEIYKVLRLGIYLSPYDEAKSGLNVISESHKKRGYTLSGILRLLHYKTKLYPRLNRFRRIISKFIGLDIKTDAGDVIIFLANLFHSGIPTIGLRETIFLSYGVDNKHSKNYVNYYMQHRKGWEMNNNEQSQEFIKILKNKNIYFTLPEKKDEIRGISVPLAER